MNIGASTGFVCFYEVVETSVFRKKIGVEAWRGVFIFLRPCPRKRRAVDSGLSVFTNPARCLVISAESFDFVIGIYKILEKEKFQKMSLSLCLPPSRVREKREILFILLYSSLYILILLSLEKQLRLSVVCRLIVVLFVVLFGVITIIVCINVNYRCFRFVVWFVDFGGFLSRYPPQTLVTVCRSFVVFIF